VALASVPEYSDVTANDIKKRKSKVHDFHDIGTIFELLTFKKLITD
jgi:hypothetical protein